MAQTLDSALPAPRGRSSRRLLALRGDAHLVARLRAGDDVAFEVLYDRYAGVLLSFCRHMLGRAEEAEDAVQQVFASAHSALQRDDRAVEVKPWLYSIARNRCLTMLRARREHPDPEVEPVTAGLQDQVEKRADLRQLVGDLAELPENQRAALLLTELDDMSHADVAKVLECEVSQVKGLVFRARSGLIERRDAREASCEEIRAELATARRGGLRRGRLRHHLAHCAGCTAYLEDVRRQRRMMALILPVIPATGLKRSVLAAAGIGTGAGGAGGITLAGGSAVTATVAKVALVGALAGGAGVAGESVINGRDKTPPAPAPAAVAPASPAPASATPSPAKDRLPANGRGVDRGSRPGSPPAARGKAKGRDRQTPADQRSRSQRGAAPPGLAHDKTRGRSDSTPARPTVPPGRAKQTPAAPRATPPPGARSRGTLSPAPRTEPKLRLKESKPAEQ